MPNTREKLIELLKSGGVREFPFNAALADHLIANGVTVNEWISVKDRLPDLSETVLAVDRDGIIASAYYVGNWHSGGELDEYAVTHWMPLPEPPKGE